MLELLLFIASASIGAALGIVVTLFQKSPRMNSAPLLKKIDDDLADPVIVNMQIPDMSFHLPDPQSSAIPAVNSESSAWTRCYCGLELPAPLMAEHADSTGHSKPMAMGTVRVGKIWELEEAVIGNASPSCVKCGQPVVGLKRVGKTIYVTHLGCSEVKAEVANETGSGNGNGQTTEVVSQQNAATVSTRKRVRRDVTCPICWRSTRGGEFTRVKSVKGRTLRFHEDCLSFQ